MNTQISFYNFMVANKTGEDSVVGDLAEDIQRVSNFPKDSHDKDEILQHFRGYLVDDDVYEAFYESWEEYLAH